MGVRRLAVANGPNIFQMLLVLFYYAHFIVLYCTYVQLSCVGLLNSYTHTYALPSVQYS